MGCEESAEPIIKPRRRRLSTEMKLFVQSSIHPQQHFAAGMRPRQHRMTNEARLQISCFSSVKERACLRSGAFSCREQGSYTIAYTATIYLGQSGASSDKEMRR